uniref:Uncharacterized protein n=1 Tax=Romanomermis culicivorax TaxID=13658 RepID=A0A915JB36_ROMCU
MKPNYKDITSDEDFIPMEILEDITSDEEEVVVDEDLENITYEEEQEEEKTLNNNNNILDEEGTFLDYDIDENDQYKIIHHTVPMKKKLMNQFKLAVGI